MIPFVQLLLLPWAADYEVKNIHVTIVDHDHSVYSRQLISKIGSSGYFQINNYTASYKEAVQHISNNKADIVLEIPSRFEKDLVKQQEVNLLMAVNSINGTKAILGSSYLQRMISDFNGMIREEWMQLPRLTQSRL
jgi:ABC-2 type transport system permease protein